MDNLRAHKVAGIKEAIEAVGAELRYLELSGILCEDHRMELERSTFYGDQERDFGRTFSRVGR
jgi:hypothetical protein